LRAKLQNVRNLNEEKETNYLDDQESKRLRKRERKREKEKEKKREEEKEEREKERGPPVIFINMIKKNATPTRPNAEQNQITRERERELKKNSLKWKSGIEKGVMKNTNNLHNDVK
jgi:hypothetical protein